MLLIVLLIVALPILAIFVLDGTLSGGRRKQWEQMQAQERSLRDALQLDELASGRGRAIGVSGRRRAVAVIDQAGTGFWIPFDRVAAVELVREYETHASSFAETQTSRGSQLVGAALGAAVAGPAGLVVGGLSGKTTTQSYGSSTQSLRALHLKLRLYSNETPFLSLALHGEEAVECIAARLQNEIDLRGAGSTTGELTSAFERLNTEGSVTAVLETPRLGWWQQTFG